MKEKKWMQKAFNPEHKGLLHRELGIPAGQKIPHDKLVAASRANGKVGERAHAALNAAKFKK